MDILWITDPGHGWLRVPKETVDRFGIHVSDFSYVDAFNYYLEEDVDAAQFIDEAGIRDLIIQEICVDDFSEYRRKAGIVSI